VDITLISVSSPDTHVLYKRFFLKNRLKMQIYSLQEQIMMELSCIRGCFDKDEIKKSLPVLEDKKTLDPNSNSESSGNNPNSSHWPKDHARKKLYHQHELSNHDKLLLIWKPIARPIFKKNLICDNF